MRRLSIILLCLLFAVSASAQTVIVAKKKAGGCTASYGAELATGANATDDLGGSETDATTGWINYNADVFDSVDTGTPHSGTYHLIATAIDSGDGFYRTISGLSASTVYRVAAWVKHDGTADATWSCGLGGAAGQRNFGASQILAAQTTYTEYEIYTLFNAVQDTFSCVENNAANNGSIYLDDFSITAATLCYGPELYSSANAANIASETDATTGWTAINDGTVASEETNSPHNGSSHIAVAATGTQTGGAYADIGGAFGLQVGQKYFIRFWARGDNTNAFFFVLDGNPTSAAYAGGVVTVTSSTYAEYGFSFVYATATNRYLKIIEGNAGNTGTAYIDGISILNITGE